MRASYLAFASLVLSACGSSQATPLPAEAPPTPPEPAEAADAGAAATPLSPAEAQKKALAAYGAAWDAHDAKKAAAFYAEGAVMKMAGAPDASGTEAIGGAIAGALGAAQDGKVPFVRTFTQGNVVVGEWVWAGTQTGDFMGLPPTGKPFGVEGVSIYFFTPDAKLKEAHAYFDGGTLMSQLGVSKKKARPIAALPTTPVEELTSTGSPEERRNIESVKKMVGAFESKDAAGFTAALADDVVWDDMGQPQTSKGKDAAVKYFKMMTKAFPDAKIAVTNAWATGDYVVTEQTFTGTHKGALGPIPATNKAVTLHGVDIAQFAPDGKIVKGRSYMNSGELMMQLGLVPPPGAPAKASAKK